MEVLQVAEANPEPPSRNSIEPEDAPKSSSAKNETKITINEKCTP